ncbi:MAG: hypothetical protein R3F30_05425 [Planctomycetota bacterium]
MKTPTLTTLGALPMILLSACAASGGGDPALRAELEAAESLFSGRRYAEAGEAYRAVAEHARDERAVRCEALAMAARCASLCDDLAGGRALLEEAGRLADPEEPASWSRYRIVYGIYLREEGRREEALACFDELYRYCEAHGLHRRAVDAVHHAAIVAPLHEQEAWAMRGIAAAEACDAGAWLAVLWNNLGSTYEELGRPEDMLRAYREAQRYHHAHSRPLPAQISDWAVGHALRLCGRPDEARAVLEPCLAAFTAMDEAGDPAGAAEWIGWTSWELGELDLAAGDRDAARPLLLRAEELLAAAHLDRHWPEGWARLQVAVAKVRD